MFHEQSGYGNSLWVCLLWSVCGRVLLWPCWCLLDRRKCLRQEKVSEGVCVPNKRSGRGISLWVCLLWSVGASFVVSVWACVIVGVAAPCRC